MNPGLQLHRSITFWSGILVMGFIGWAWRDSLVNQSQLARRGWALSNYAGGVLAEWGTDPSICFPWTGREPHPPDRMVSAFKGPSLERGGTRDYKADFSEYLRKRSEGDRISTSIDLRAELGLPPGPLDQPYGAMCYRPPGDWRLFIPHWLVLGVFTMGWVAMLGCRGWRRRKLETL